MHLPEFICIWKQKLFLPLEIVEINIVLCDFFICHFEWDNFV